MQSIDEAVRAQCRCGGFCNGGLVCKSHPWVAWPHDDCPASGMPCSQPIRDPARPTSGETFIAFVDVFLKDPFPWVRPEDQFWQHVRSLGLQPEDYEAHQCQARWGWILLRKRSG